jgi:hypothetical protein
VFLIACPETQSMLVLPSWLTTSKTTVATADLQALHSKGGQYGHTHQMHNIFVCLRSERLNQSPEKNCAPT